LKSPLNPFTSKCQFFPLLIKYSSIPISLQLLLLVTFYFYLPRLLQSFLVIQHYFNIFLILLFWDLLRFLLIICALFLYLITSSFGRWLDFGVENLCFDFLFALCSRLLYTDSNWRTLWCFEGLIGGKYV
jgi:hypothetical protein